MLLKRFYKKPDGGETQLDYVSLGHTGSKPEQNFSSGLINAAIAEGWCTISKGKLVLHVLPEDLVYTINRVPGRYCCHCGEKLDDDSSGELARGHVARVHAGEKSPDPNNPSGYCMINAYECVLEKTQHEKFRLKHPAKPPVFPRKEQNNG